MYDLVSFSPDKSKNIQFKESDILYTKSEIVPEEFCFVSFKGKFKGETKKKLLEGNFIGIYDDRDTCAIGKLKLVSTKFVKKKIKKVYISSFVSTLWIF
jgi:hypothetical protein